MGRHGLLAPHRVGRPQGRAHDGTITTIAVDVFRRGIGTPLEG
jgi:hypothetical protein